MRSPKQMSRRWLNQLTAHFAGFEVDFSHALKTGKQQTRTLLSGFIV
jgi:hypothetical protein